MRISIPDEILASAGLSEQQIKLELACALFHANRLDAGRASQLAGIDREEFDAELARRGISPYQYNEDAWRQDLETLKAWRTDTKADPRQEGHAA